jgi:hypothetical protein
MCNSGPSRPVGNSHGGCQVPPAGWLAAQVADPVGHRTPQGMLAVARRAGLPTHAYLEAGALAHESAPRSIGSPAMRA